MVREGEVGGEGEPSVAMSMGWLSGRACGAVGCEGMFVPGVTPWTAQIEDGRPGEGEAAEDKQPAHD